MLPVAMATMVVTVCIGAHVVRPCVKLAVAVNPRHTSMQTRRMMHVAHDITPLFTACGYWAG